MSYTKFAIGLRRFLNHPGRVAFACMFVFGVAIVLNGNLWRLWNLHRDFDRVRTEITLDKKGIFQLQDQLKQAKDPAFIERQARDKLDLAGEHDLVFVFSEQ